MSFPPRYDMTPFGNPPPFYPEPSTSHHTSDAPIPPNWRRCFHPNGDVYYYNSTLRLITPDDICDPTVLNYVLEARDDRIQCLEEDTNYSRLPRDWELVISDVSDSTAVIAMHSRMASASYDWNEETGLRLRGREHFWSYVAEFPSHHTQLPPNAEAEFAQALTNARSSIASGAVFPFSASEIDHVIARYQQLKGLQAQGRSITPFLGWFIGAIMPLDSVERIRNGDIEALMSSLRI